MDNVIHIEQSSLLVSTETSIYGVTAQPPHNSPDQTSFRSTDGFHQFLKLPLEIREYIWLAAIERRRVHVQPHIMKTLARTYPTAWADNYKVPTRRAPTLLHTCQESRRSVAKYYQKLIFFVHNPGYESLEGYKWVNLDVDTVVIEDAKLGLGSLAYVLDDIKHLSILTTEWDQRNLRAVSFMKVVVYSKVLEDVEVMGQQLQDADGNDEPVGVWMKRWEPFLKYWSRTAAEKRGSNLFFRCPITVVNVGPQPYVRVPSENFLVFHP